MTRKLGFALFGITWLAAGCGASSDEGEVTGCMPGTSLSCACSNGTYGAQTCNSAGSYDPCGNCGHMEPIAPVEPVPMTPMMPGEPPPPSTMIPPVEQPPVMENPDNYPPCGSDPASQPTPCLDAGGALRCKVDSGYDGDELALCDFDISQGMMVHFGPKDYDDPNQVRPFVMAPGEESEVCMYINTPNPTEQWVAEYHGRMRPNSHHLIVTMPAQHHPDDVAPWRCSSQVLDRWLFGAQDPQIDVNGVSDGSTPPQPGDPDYGLAQQLPANQTLLFDFHNINASDREELREAWASFEFVDPNEVHNQIDMIAFYQFDISIPPLARATTQRKTCTAPANLAGQQQPVYVGLMTAHAHERLTRFSVWHNKLGGQSELVYETIDWEEPGNAMYRDAIQNPGLPLAANQLWGAKTGYLRVEPGESISFECEFQNNLSQTVRFGDTTSDEMCNVFGMYYPTVGGMWNCLF